MKKTDIGAILQNIKTHYKVCAIAVEMNIVLNKI
jgi:hypothetical protein